MFPAGVKGNLAIDKAGMALGGILKDGGGLAQARLAAVDPATLATQAAMAAIMMEINKKLDNIQEMQQRILDFLEQDKQAEQQANLNVLTDILEGYKHNWDNAQYLQNHHMKALDIKQTAEKNIIFYQEQIAASIKKMMANNVKEHYDGEYKFPNLPLCAKTGTANKLREDGRGYSGDTYSSCIAMAPMDDPKIAVLVIVDSPKGAHFGSVTAAPAVGNVLNKTLPYLNIAADPKVREDNEKEAQSKMKEVPDLVGKGASDAAAIMEKNGLDYDLDDSADSDDFIVIRQYPDAGTRLKKGSKVYLYK